MRKKRTTFEFDSETTRLLEALQGPLHASTKSEVIRRALKIAGTLAVAEQKGAAIYIKEADGGELVRLMLI